MLIRHGHIAPCSLAAVLLAAGCAGGAQPAGGIGGDDPGAQASPGIAAAHPPSRASVPTTGQEVLAGGGNDYPPRGLPRIYATASWPLYSTFDGVVSEADLFVVAEVVGVRPGRTVGDPALPFTNADLLVTDVGRGNASPGRVITLEQTGGIYRPTHAAQDAKGSVEPLPSEAPVGAQPYPPADITDSPVVLELRDDPLLAIGQRVAVALRWNAGLELYQLVNPQGRFRVDANGRVHPARLDDPAVQMLDGLTVQDLLELVRSVPTA